MDIDEMSQDEKYLQEQQLQKKMFYLISIISIICHNKLPCFCGRTIYKIRGIVMLPVQLNTTKFWQYEIMKIIERYCYIL